MYQRTTFNVVFFCKKTKISKKGKAPIYARITTSGQTTEIYTQCQIEPERWNQRLERSLYKGEVDQQINSIVASYRANILAAYDLLLKENKTPDCFSIKQRLSNASGSRMFLVEFSKYCDKRQQEVGTRITQVTCNKYHRLLRYMTEYTKQQYRKDDLPLDMVSYEYIDGLNTFMQTAHQCRNNGAVNLLCCLKNFILFAIRNEWIEKNPFQYYKMKIDKTNVKVPLTKEELDILISKEMPNERLECIRDVFCFCALTGLAYADVKGLTTDNLQTMFDGNLWIITRRKKTNTESRIRLLDIPKRIIEKYADQRLDNHVFYMPCNCHCNDILREIGKQCGIKNKLTFHMARHTFATTITLSQGMPIETVSCLLGHTNIKTTQIYAKITNEKISRDMSALTERLGDKYRLAE